MKRRLFSLGALVFVGCDALPIPEATFAPPDAPVFSPYSAVTASPEITVRGVKPASTAIVVDDEVVVPLTEATTFGLTLVLNEGGNSFRVEAEDAFGQRSDPARLALRLDQTAPEPPTLSPIAGHTLLSAAVIAGENESDCTPVVNGDTSDDDTRSDHFAIGIALAVGDNAVRAACIDEAGSESALVRGAIVRHEALPFALDAVTATQYVASPQTRGNIVLTGARSGFVQIDVDDETFSGDGSTTDAAPFVVTVERALGSHSLAVHAHFAGETSALDFVQTVPVTLSSDGEAPTLSVTQPLAGAEVSGVVAIAATATDDRGIARVLACIGACAVDADFVQLAGTGDTFAGSVDLSERVDLPVGAAVLHVRAIDVAGRTVNVGTNVVRTAEQEAP